MITLSLQEKQQLGNILETLADSIDLTEAQYKLAIERYNTVGEFLSSRDSLLYSYKPVIVPQGSFKIGTPVRPINDDGEFDVDLTCRLLAVLPLIQSDLKRIVGEQLSSKEVYKKILKEMRRCWRLKYAESSRFHLDIVPAIPDDYKWILDQGVPFEYAKHAICITDNERSNYKSHISDWPKSNPEGYAAWFLDVMKIEATRIRMELKAQLLLERVEDVPDYKVRTPLQRGIQLMKRHRDVMFNHDEDCPISIIITTLAAKAYESVIRNSNSFIFYDLIIKIVETMPSFIEKRDGISWIPNPVNPKENFADKWQVKTIREANFYKWHSAFLRSLTDEKLKKGITSLGDHLKENYGTRSVNEAMDKLGNVTRQSREKGQLHMSNSGLLGAAGVLVKNHTFDGVE